VAYLSGAVGVEILVFVCYNIVGFDESCKTICWLTASETNIFRGLWRVGPAGVEELTKPYFSAITLRKN
jgi:hypothetical protein